MLLWLEEALEAAACRALGHRLLSSSRRLALRTRLAFTLLLLRRLFRFLLLLQSLKLFKRVATSLGRKGADAHLA